MTNVIKNEAPPMPMPYKGIKENKPTTFKEDFGKVLIDFGKVLFGSIFIGSVLCEEIPRITLGASGFFGAAARIFVGLSLAKKEEKE